jgi:uncharacterized protein (TIGR00251 family)
MAFYTLQDDTLVLRCLVQPKSSRDEIIGVQDERLKVRITAPPVDGKANAHLVRYLAEVLDVPRSHIALTTGDTGKRKTFRISGIGTLPPALQAFEDTPP